MSIPAGYFCVDFLFAGKNHIEEDGVIEVKADARKVRIRPDLYAQMEAIIEGSKKGEGLTQVGLVNEALEQWLSQRSEGARPVPAPRTDEERTLVTALLATMRGKDWEIYGPPLTALLQEHMPAKPAKRPGGKKGAA